jgi:hypothetical protein
MAGYLAEVADVRGLLDGRYDAIRSGCVKTIDGETFFEDLRQRKEKLLNRLRPE